MSEQQEKSAQTASRSWWASKWILPVFSVVMGVAMWGASWAGGHHGQGAISFGILAAFRGGLRRERPKRDRARYARRWPR